MDIYDIVALAVPLLLFRVFGAMHERENGTIRRELGAATLRLAKWRNRKRIY